MSEEEINEIVKEHYGFTVEEIDNMVGNLSLKINQLEQERNNYKELYEKEKDLVDTILTFNLFGDECPLNFGFENGSPQEKAQKLFYEDDGEFCENNCDDCYKKCWLNFFNRIQELKCKK